MVSATSERQEFWIVGPSYGATHDSGASRTVLNIAHTPRDPSSIVCHYSCYSVMRPDELASEKWRKEDRHFKDLTMTEGGRSDAGRNKTTPQRRLETAIECSAPHEIIELFVKTLDAPLPKNILEHVVCIRGADVCVERTSAAARFHIDQSARATMRKVEALFTFLMSQGAELQPTIFERLFTGNMPAEARLPMLEMLFKMCDARAVPFPKNLFDIALAKCLPYETGKGKSEEGHNPSGVLQFLLAHNFRPVNLTQEAIIADITSATIKLRMPFEILEILIKTEVQCRKILLRYFLFNLRYRLPDDEKILALVVKHAEKSELESCLFDVVFLSLEKPEHSEKILKFFAGRGVQASAESFIRQLFRNDWIPTPCPHSESSVRLPFDQSCFENILTSLSKIGIPISKQSLREIILRVGEEGGIHSSHIKALVTEGYLVPTEKLFKLAANNNLLDVVEFLVSRSEPALLANIQLNIIPWFSAREAEFSLKIFKILSGRSVPTVSADTLVKHLCEKYVIKVMIIKRLGILFHSLGLALNQQHICDILINAYENKELRQEDIKALVEGKHLCIDEELYFYALNKAPRPVVGILLDANPKLCLLASSPDLTKLVVLADEYKESPELISLPARDQAAVAAVHDNP